MPANISSLTGGTILTVSLAQPLDPATQAVLTSLAQRMKQAMPWTSFDPVGTFALAMQQNQYPYPTPSIVNPPVWLNDPDRMNTWRQIAGAFTPVTRNVLINQIALARQEGATLAANVDFWNTVAKYSGADAVQQIWDTLWATIEKARLTRQAAKIALDQGQAIVSQYGAQLPIGLVQNHALLVSQYNTASSQLANAVAPLGAAGRAAAGLGVVQIIAGIAAATVVTITASVAAVAYFLAQVQMQANNNAMALIQARDAVARALLNAGKITPDQFIQMQKDNVDAGNALVDAQGAGQVGKGLRSAGIGVAMGIGSLAALSVGGYFLYKYVTKKKSA